MSDHLTQFFFHSQGGKGHVQYKGDGITGRPEGCNNKGSSATQDAPQSGQRGVDEGPQDQDPVIRGLIFRPEPHREPLIET